LTDLARRQRARAIQQRLEAFYELEAGPDVTEFVRDANAGERETLIVREETDAVELALVLPEWAEGATLDDQAQIVEGVSHFVFVAERARVELPATALELELQAEIDKFVFFAFDGGTFLTKHGRTAAERLFGNVRHLHPEESEHGVRYRLAARLAERLIGRLVARARASDVRRLLQRFYRAGQADKIRFATAC
jgi:hypothetical protein